MIYGIRRVDIWHRILTYPENKVLQISICSPYICSSKIIALGLLESIFYFLFLSKKIFGVKYFKLKVSSTPKTYMSPLPAHESRILWIMFSKINLKLDHYDPVSVCVCMCHCLTMQVACLELKIICNLLQNYLEGWYQSAKNNKYNSETRRSVQTISYSFCNVDKS